MFRSVFTRYITVFSLIIGVSFIILMLIFSAMLKNYSIESKEYLMEQSALNTEEVIKFFSDYLMEEKFQEAISRYNDRILASVNDNADFAESFIIVTDKYGKVLIASESYRVAFGNVGLSPKVVESFITKNSQFYVGTLDIYSAPHRNFVKVIYNSHNQIDGLIFVSSETFSENVLSSKMTTLVIAASLWVFLAALLAVYYISRKISEPLKEIANAASSFSVGKMDVRVGVYGKDEVAELSKTFNNMAESLQHLEKQRATFISNISHDLRTPMTSITGFVDGILDGTIPKERQEHYLEIISSESKRLSRLVNTLLEISRIEARDLSVNMKPYNLSEQVRLIILSFEQKISKKNIDVELDIPDEEVYVFADMDAIHQVIYNLCDNAVKFTNTNGLITISLLLDKEKKVFVSIKNTGTGISKEDLPFVFERFYKTDRSRGLDKTGMGIGLFIVKTIVNKHGEEIKVYSEENEYCEFRFSLSVCDPLKKDFSQ